MLLMVTVSSLTVLNLRYHLLLKKDLSPPAPKIQQLVVSAIDEHGLNPVLLTIEEDTVREQSFGELPCPFF